MEEKNTPTLKVYSPEEIELFLAGDRRDVDRLLLHSINGLAAFLIPHSNREDAMLDHIEDLGGIEAIQKRAKYVDTLIERQNIRNRMMEKVATSNVVYASVAFFGYLFYCVKDDVIRYIQSGLK